MLTRSADNAKTIANVEEMSQIPFGTKQDRVDTLLLKDISKSLAIIADELQMIRKQEAKRK